MANDPLNHMFFNGALDAPHIPAYVAWRDSNPAVRFTWEENSRAAQKAMEQAVAVDTTGRHAAAVAARTADADIITSWLRANQAAGHTAVAHAAARNKRISQQVFNDADDTTREHMLNGGVLASCTRRQAATILSWTLQRWPAGSMLTGEQLDVARLTATHGHWASAVSHDPELAHWLTAARCLPWLDDYASYAAACLLSRAPLPTSDEQAEMAAIADRFRPDNSGSRADWLAVADAITDRRSTPEINDACRHLTEGDVPAAIRLLDEHHRDNGQLWHGAAVTRAVADLNLDPATKQQLITAAFNLDLHLGDVLAGAVTHLARTLPVDQAADAALAGLSGAAVRVDAVARLEHRVAEHLLWTTPADHRAWKTLVRYIAEHPEPAEAIRRRVEQALGHTGEYHALAPSWEGSAEQLVVVILAARQ